MALACSCLTQGHSGTRGGGRAAKPVGPDWAFSIQLPNSIKHPSEPSSAQHSVLPVDKELHWCLEQDSSKDGSFP